MLGLDKKQSGTVAVLLAGTFLAVLNQTLLTPALPTIMRDLQVDATTVQWLTSGYSLVEAVVIPLSAFLMGRFSTRRLFTCGLAIFAVGSLLGACAPVFWVLLLGRLLQACCTGMLLPMATSLILLVFPKEKRGSAMGMVGLIIGFAPAVGPVLAGLLIDGIGWRALFVLVAILTAIIIVCGLKLLYNYEGFARTHCDVLSIVFSSVGMVCFLYGLSICTSSDTLIVPLALILIGAVFIALFVRRQFRLEQPMLNIGILKTKNYRVTVIVVAIIQAGFLGMQVILPLYIQGTRGYSATMSGLALLPGALVGALATMVAGKLFDKFGVRKVVIPGGIIALVGAVGLTLFDMDTMFLFVMLVYLVLSVGLQAVMTPMNTWGVNSLDNSVVQHAQSLSNTINQVAGSFGTVLLVSLSAWGTSLAPAVASPAEATFAGYHWAFCASGILFVIFFMVVLLFARGSSSNAERKGEAHPDLQDVMVTEVYRVSEAASAYDAMMCLVEHKTSGVPVIDERGSVVGFVSDGDLVRTLADGSHDRTSMYWLYAAALLGEDFNERLGRLRDIPVMDIATRKVVSVDVKEGVDGACKVLSSVKIKKVPVLSDGHLIGVISRADLMRYLVATGIEKNASTVS